MVVGHPELGILFSTTMTRNNDINDGSRGRDGNGSEDAKRPRSLSESSFGDHSHQQQQQHLHLLQRDNNDTDWLLAHNQQRLQMLAQSDALAAVAAAAGDHHHHNLPSLNLHQPQLDDLNPISRAGGGGGGMGEAAGLLAAQQSQQQPQRVLALENAQTQLAAAMIRQRQAEDTLRQCQQQQAVAVAEYLQQQAIQQQQQQQQLSPHHHQHFGGIPQGTSSNSSGSATAGASKSPVPQQAMFNDPAALSGGLYDHLQQQPMGSTTNQQQAAMSRNSIAAAAAGGMSFGAHERSYRIPVEHFASYNTTTERLVPNRHHATSATNSNHNDEAAAAAAVFNATNMGETNGTATFNVSNANIVPGYSSFLLSSTPAPLDSHIAPVPLALPVQLAGSVTAGSGMKKEGPPLSSPKPRKSAKHKSSNSSTGSVSSATGAAAVSSSTTPKISIAGPKRRPVSLQALVNRGDACYDPGPVRELALPSDRCNLSEYQCLLRKQIVLFSVSINDIQCSAQGRNKPIVIGQVGVLCRHCARIPPGMRPCGASYFPGKLSGLYQAAQNMAINHLTKSCRSIADDTKEALIKLKAQKSTVLGGGKNFWANGAKVLGVVEVEEGHLRFQDG